MQILFIQDNAINESLALTELSALLESKGNRCELLLTDEEGDIIPKIISISPDLIIFPLGIFGHKMPLKLSKKIKERLDTPVVFGGEHPTFYPEIIENEGVDIVCRGEAEKPISELVEKLERDGEITDIDGLWVEENGQIHKNPLASLVKDLDELPLPDREIYYKYDFIRDFPMKKFMTGRGCFHSCGYCFNPILRKEYKGNEEGKYIRKKSPDRAVNEVEKIGEKYPLKHIHFADDLFTAEKAWAKKFCEIYKQRVSKPFTFNTTADQIDEDIVDWVSDANCQGVAVGVESGNLKLRRKILNKNTTNEEIIRACKLIKGKGMKLTTFNMLGNPSETLEKAFQTININQKINCNNPRVTISHPVPKTSLYQWAVENGYLDEEKYLKEDITKGMREEVFYEIDNKGEFENLYCLFAVACKFPRLTSLVRKLIKMPKNSIFKLIKKMTSSWNEKNFYNIPILEGIKFYTHTGSPYKRTTNFCSLI